MIQPLTHFLFGTRNLINRASESLRESFINSRIPVKQEHVLHRLSPLRSSVNWILTAPDTCSFCEKSHSALRRKIILLGNSSYHSEPRSIIAQYHSLRFVGQEVIGLFLTPQQVFSSSTGESNELLDHSDHSNAVTVLTATAAQNEQVQ